MGIGGDHPDNAASHLVSFHRHLVNRLWPTHTQGPGSTLTAIPSAQHFVPLPFDSVRPAFAWPLKDGYGRFPRRVKAVLRSPRDWLRKARRRVPRALDWSADCFPRRVPAEPIR